METEFENLCQNDQEEFIEGLIDEESDRIGRIGKDGNPTSKCDKNQKEMCSDFLREHFDREKFNKEQCGNLIKWFVKMVNIEFQIKYELNHEYLRTVKNPDGVESFVVEVPQDQYDKYKSLADHLAGKTGCTGNMFYIIATMKDSELYDHILYYCDLGWEKSIACFLDIGIEDYKKEMCARLNIERLERD